MRTLKLLATLLVIAAAVHPASDVRRFIGWNAQAMTSRAPEPAATWAARSTATYELGDPSVPTRTVV